MKLINHLKHIAKAFYYSLCGLKIVWQDNVAFRQEAFLSIIIIPLGLILGTTNLERAILLGSWLLVIIVELINSSIESVVDRISLEIHPLSKKIKDMSSAAVLLSIVNAIIVWVVILI